MKLVQTALAGVLILEIEPIADERGFFARVWDDESFAALGLTTALTQVSVAFNEVAGTLRGLHYQAEPHAEAKTVRCTAGAIYDVAVDLREDSPTRNSWVGAELSAWNRRGFFIPEGCAHGYITLTDATEVMYQISVRHEPTAKRGYRWDDPAFGIDWPLAVRRISAADSALPLFGT